MKNLIDNAIRKTNTQMRKKTTKRRLRKDLFPCGSIFDFSDDAVNFVKTPRTRPLDVKNWKESDFISYFKSRIEKNLIRNAVYDKNCLLRLRDYLTINLEIATGDKESFCDNNLLKRYFDWWLINYGASGKEIISTEVFCKEKYVREFFKTESWDVTETSDTVATAFKNVSPPKMTPQETYSSGGLKKLIYEIGIIDSYYYLITSEKKSSQDAFKEIRKSLNKVHDAVFHYVLKKTFTKAPYDIKKEMDLRKLLKPVLSKKGELKLEELQFDALFNKEEK